jgi:HK97 family phage major capsid protein
MNLPKIIGGFEVNEHSAGFSTIDVSSIVPTYRRAASRPSATTSARASVSSAAPRKREPNGFESLAEFIHVARTSPQDPRLSYVEKTDDGMQASMRTDDGASGGFAIPVQFRSQLLSLKTSPAIMRPNAFVLPPGEIPDGRLEVPALDQSSGTNMTGGVVVKWIAEGGLKPETDAKVRQVILQPQEVAAIVKVTDKLLRNWRAAGQFIADTLRAAIAAAEDVAFLMGNGVGKPLGALNSPSRIEISRTNPGEITYADVLAMDETLFGLGESAFWVCSKRARTWLRQLKNPAGYYIWHEDASTNSPPLLMGHPVRYSDRVPTMGNRGDLMLLDMGAYLIKDGSGPYVSFSEHLYFETNETLVKVFWNVDGQPWTRAPIKTEDGDLQSHFIVLN